MPLDYRKVYQEIVAFARKAGAIYQEQDKQRERALALLQDWAQEGEALRERVEQAGRLSAHWRSASPFREPLAAAIDPPQDADALVAQALLLAADGSQIEPNPHAALYYGLVNVGVVVMGSDVVPRTRAASRFWSPEDLSRQALHIALHRDLRERAVLAEAAQVLKGQRPVPQGWEDFYADLPPKPHLITLTDGPLELWGADEDPASAFHEVLHTYIGHLHTLTTLGAVSAGYVDKPRANLVVHMLALADLQAAPQRDDVRRILRRDFAFWETSDLSLFGEWLKPGQRSAVFALASPARRDYRDRLALHFFYLNTSADPHSPTIARVEIPQDVAARPEALDVLHAVLLWQSRRVPEVAYPYVLHRAHEVAVVRREDRQAVEAWLQEQLLAHGLHPGRKSAKQRLKDFR